MRHNNNNNNNNRRMRHNGGRSNNNNNNGGGQQHSRPRSNVPPRMQVYDSNGPDVRIRGTAFQVHEKYLALAKDAGSSGDLIMAENYSQHAEHYQRIINTFEPAWIPQNNNQPNDNAEGQEPSEQPVEVRQDQPQPRQQQQQAQRNEDLGLPSSLFGRPSQSTENPSDPFSETA